MTGWTKLAAFVAVAAILANTTGGAGATSSPAGATKAGSATRSTATTLAARRGALLRNADLKTLVGVRRYLRAIGVNPRGVVIQRAARNYAGPTCPGAGWACTSTSHPVVQIAAAGGKNTFLCTSARCAVVQLAARGAARSSRSLAATAAKPNNAACIKTTGLTQSCSISQTSATANNMAVVYQNAGKFTGLTQSASYSASVNQQATGSSNTNSVCVLQATAIDGSTVAKAGTPVTVTLESHQFVGITQDSLGGGNSAQQSATSTGGCTGTAVTQTQTLTSTTTGSGPITQNENAASNGANMTIDIEQNQGAFKGSAQGQNFAIFNQSNSLSAIANTPGQPVSQTQSSQTGGILATVNQDSRDVSKADTTQTEFQCEDAAPSGLTSCSTSRDTNTPPSLTQTQFGPARIAQAVGRGPGRELMSVKKGGGATQTGNAGDTFKITQSSEQHNDSGTQNNDVQGDCTTSGTCTGTQSVNNNNGQTNNGNAGTGDVKFNTSCTSNCQTTANFPSGNILVSIGNGQVQMWNSTGTTLLHTFDTGTASFTTGLAFDPAKSFYVTDFNANAVTKFNSDGTLSGPFGSGYNANPESIVFDSSGNAFVGQAGDTVGGTADGTQHVLEFSSAGAPLTTFAPDIEDRGTDWIDLAPDGHTLYYTSEGPSVKRFDVSGTGQLADFVTGLAAPAFAVKVLPNNDVLVADTTSIILFDPNGIVLHTYGAGGTNWFSLALDPSGSAFWAGDAANGTVTKFDLSTTAVLATFTTGSSVSGGKADGLAVAP
jgi:hypothetical protein